MKHGEKVMPWLTKLKIAIAEQNIENIENLIDNLPKFTNAQELEEAQYLFKEVAILLHTLKDETQSTMQQIQKNLTFLRATETQTATRLDIKS